MRTKSQCHFPYRENARKDISEENKEAHPERMPFLHLCCPLLLILCLANK